MEQINQLRMDYLQPAENHQTKGQMYACKASRRGYQQARDRLRRAERDLGETAAFIAASLTTVTAIQAVISIAHDRLGLSQEILRSAFEAYIAIFLVILVGGALRARNAIRRRAQAEKELDQTKKGIFEFCPTDQWPKLDE
ncbi:MAG TPA: hypothetical protein VI524_13975 [Anaerolineales bacterium]|nr:hypothetical protein [Anaerolineales bacterium]